MSKHHFNVTDAAQVESSPVLSTDVRTPQEAVNEALATIRARQLASANEVLAIRHAKEAARDAVARGEKD